MAVLNSIDPQLAQRGLETWLRESRPTATDVSVRDVNVPAAAGFSMTTILFTAAWTEAGKAHTAELVARLALDGPALFEAPDLSREYRLLEVLGAQTEVAVPKALAFVPDASLLGGPFIVMERALGQVPADDPPYVLEGWVVDLEPDRRAELYDHALQTLAQLHALDWRALGLEFLAEPGDKPGIDRELADLQRYYDWARGDGSSPTLDAAFELLRLRPPADDELVLNWGDARIGNIVFDPETLAPAAVLDWEMATIASPEMDLGWLTFFVRFYSEGLGVPIPEGMQTGDELVERYQLLTGRTVRNLEFYEALAALRTSIFLLRIGNLMIEVGAAPEDSPMPISNPASNLLARLLDLPAPTGSSELFMEHR